MAISSHAFGRVTLTDDDAETFAKQVRYGRSNKSAKDAVSHGVAIAKIVKNNGKFSFSVAKSNVKKARIAK